MLGRRNRLDILDSTANTSHKRMSEELQNDIQTIQAQLSTIIGAAPSGDMSSTNHEIKIARYNMSMNSTPDAHASSPLRTLPGDEPEQPDGGSDAGRPTTGVRHEFNIQRR